MCKCPGQGNQGSAGAVRKRVAGLLPPEDVGLLAEAVAPVLAGEGCYDVDGGLLGLRVEECHRAIPVDVSLEPEFLHAHSEDLTLLRLS